MSHPPTGNNVEQAGHPSLIDQDASAAPQFVAAAGFQNERSRLASILDQMPVGVGVLDRTGAIRHTNAQFGGFVASGFVASTTVDGAMRWDGFNSRGQRLRPDACPGSRALRGEVVTPGIDLLYAGDGAAERWVRVSAMPLLGDFGGMVLGAVVVLQDIDEEKRAATRLARAEACLRQFAENSTDALWVADAVTGDMEYRSPSYFRLFGSESAAPATIHDIAARIHPDDLEQVAAHRDRVAQGDVERFDYRLLSAHGRAVRYLRETSFPIRDDADRILLVGAILEDLTRSDSVQIYFVGAQGGETRDIVKALRAKGQKVKIFASIGDLLNVAGVLCPGCVIADLRNAGGEGMSLAHALKERTLELPTIIIGRAGAEPGEVVAAMKAGAVDYLIPPIDGEKLAEAVIAAIAGCHGRPAPTHRTAGISDRLERLSPREREVLSGLVAAGTNKSIGRDLGISPRTVELHRAHLMERLNVRSLSELLQVALDAGFRTPARRTRTLSG